ncbi:General transcription factor 3C polypeptide 5 [Bienertia sinuspersici]
MGGWVVVVVLCSMVFSTICSSLSFRDSIVFHLFTGVCPDPMDMMDDAELLLSVGVNWEEYIPRESDQWKWQMVVSKLFDERPIWPRSSVYERLCNEGLKFGDHMLKRLLFRSAYYFGSGPFHRFWIRKGYDPRKDPESRL